jgi:hypothetical protein
VGFRAEANLRLSSAAANLEAETKLGQLDVLQNSLSERLSNTEGLTSNLHDLVATKADSATIDALQANFVELGRVSELVSNQVGALQTDLGNVRDELQLRVPRDVFDQLQGQFTSLGTSFGTLQTDLGSVRDELQLRVSRDVFDQLQAQFTSLDTSFGTLQTDLGSVRDELQLRVPRDVFVAL